MRIKCVINCLVQNGIEYRRKLSVVMSMAGAVLMTSLLHVYYGQCLTVGTSGIYRRAVKLSRVGQPVFRPKHLVRLLPDQTVR